MRISDWSSDVCSSDLLSDVIDNIAPTDTPFLSALKKDKCKSRFFEWQTDSLSAAANNAQIEGNDASFVAVTPTTRWGNYCQISSKNFVISRTENIVDKAGRDKEDDYQTIKKERELKRDKDFALIQKSNHNAGANETARSTRGPGGRS